MPLTFDRHLLAHYLRLTQLGLLPTEGSLIRPAIDFGLKHLKQTAGQARVLMVWSNGEPQEFKPQALPKDWSQVIQNPDRKILIGVGKPTPSKIPDAINPSGNLHASGLLVLSRLEVLAMKKLAKEIHGQYLTANGSAHFIQTLIKTATQGITEQQRKQVGTQTRWINYDRPFILATILFLFLAFYRIKLNVRKGAGLASVALVGISLMLLPSQKVFAAEKALSQNQAAQMAYDAFITKDYDVAQQYYDGLNNYTGWFGAGAAAYKTGDFESAVFYFRQASWAGKDNAQRYAALFNLGNAYYKSNLLPHAIESYQQALKYEPNNAQAKHNLALAKKRREIERGKKMKKKKGKGKSSGANGQNADGAMYGGQKPNPNKAGKGVSGDAPKGNKSGKQFVLPNEEDRTNFELNQSNHLNALTDSAGSHILKKLAQQKQIEAFEELMRPIQDQQQVLLKHLFGLLDFLSSIRHKQV